MRSLFHLHHTVPLVLILGLSLSSGGCAFVKGLGGGAPQGFRPGQVKVFPVRLQTLDSQTLQDSSLFIGTLKAAQRVVLKPEAAGRITEVFVQPGAWLTVGEPLLRLSPTRSEASLTAAQSRVAAQRAAKNTQEAQWRSAQARVKQLEADVVLQNTQLNRIQKLVQEGAFAQQSLDQVIRDRDSALAALTAARQTVTAQAAAVQEAQASLAQALAEVQSVGQDLKDTTVNSPIVGIVGNLDLKVGDYVKVGDTLTTITNNKTLEIELPIPVEYRAKVQRDLPVEIRNYTTENSFNNSFNNSLNNSLSNSLSNSVNNSLSNAPQGSLQSSPKSSPKSPLNNASTTTLTQGKIEFISPTVDATTQSILVKAKVDNPQGTLQDNQQVEARIIWETKPGILVPAEAIVRLGGETFIFVATQKEGRLIAQQRPIQLGQLQGNQYAVVSGLKAGEQIVVAGMLNLADGVAIQVQEKKPEKS
jgi:RND family efflux transporter MFP subunit